MESLPILTHDYVLVNPPYKPIQVNVSVAQYVFEQIKKFGNSPALVHSVTGEKLTYSQIIEQSVAIAAALKGKGIKSGDVVGVLSENCLEYVTVILGILAAGATCFPLNPLYTTNELLHILEIAKPVIIFCSSVVFKKIDNIRSEMHFIKEIILFQNLHLDSNNKSYQSLLTSANRNTFEIEKVNAGEDVAFLLCSSGTTGLPKCVELTHSNFVCFLDFFVLAGMKEVIQLPKVTLGLIPYFHGYGCGILLISLVSKMFHVVMPKFNEVNFLHSIQKYKVTHLYVVPPVVVFLSKHPLVSKYDLSSISSLVCGAAPLSKETQTAAQKRLNLNFDLKQGYGMTELTVCCVAFLNDYKKEGSSGTILPGMELRIVDLKNGRNLPPYEQGELCFRGPFVMKGYKNNPKETAAAFDSEGWFHTGDIGYYDKDGYIFIVSRLKELIKYKGYQVPPAELEAVLLENNAVKDAAVIGIPNEEAGELPLAFIVKQPGVDITEEEIIKYVAGKVSPQKRLHGGVKFINEIPKNPSGKILRRELQAMVNKSKL